MRPILMLALFLGLTACASVSCSDLERDGGIGGTGGCSDELSGKMAYSQSSDSLDNLHGPSPVVKQI